MCMYGYWPFDFHEYPETCLKNIPMKVWNPESGNYVDILYTHSNLVKEFLPSSSRTLIFCRSGYSPL